MRNVEPSFTKISSGVYAVSFCEIEVAIVTRCESASRTYWSIDIDPIFNTFPADFEAYENGWNRWDNTRIGAVTEHFGLLIHGPEWELADLYKANNVKTKPQQDLIDRKVIDNQGRYMLANGAEGEPAFIVLKDGNVLSCFDDEESAISGINALFDLDMSRLVDKARQCGFRAYSQDKNKRFDTPSQCPRLADSMEYAKMNPSDMTVEQRKRIDDAWETGRMAATMQALKSEMPEAMEVIATFLNKKGSIRGAQMIHTLLNVQF